VKPRQRILLRAELSDGERRTVAHVIELSEDSAFVSTSEPFAIGQTLSLQLSFRSLVKLITVSARVTSTVDRGEPGDLHGIVVELVDPDRVAAAAIAELLASAPRATESPYRVLLVEDSRLVTEMFAFGVQKFFKDKGRTVSVDVATNGAEAWSKLKSEAYDLAIVDYFLPEPVGSNLIAQVRAEPKIAGMPLVGISVGGREARSSMLEAGADLFLDKPILLKDLLATVDRLAGGIHEARAT
jgi:CheY-like chemotaxis protein